MSPVSAGGGSSAAAWAAHEGCERFRGTDPMLTGRSRAALADELHHPDTSAGIPEARWTRAMIFERLCHDPAFAGEVTARAAGWSGFDRPTAVVRADCAVRRDRTLAELSDAVARSGNGTATLLSHLAVPFPGFHPGEATSVLPDLAVVARGPAGPTLIVGDVKDYERVRSRIDDTRMLKGFLQVAMGVLAFEQWADMPGGLAISHHGFLAVPRSVFLQPTVEVEDLTDHLAEVRWQSTSRLTAHSKLTDRPTQLDGYVAGLEQAFDPTGCRSCSLFNLCRDEVRRSTDPASLLVEVGVPVAERRSVEPMLAQGAPTPAAKWPTVARLRATLSGAVEVTGQRRLDPVGRVGTVDVVVAKSDAAALGFHGVGVRRHTQTGSTGWEFEVFDDPQSDVTRRRVMTMIGRHLEHAMGENRQADPDNPEPVHVVVPDAATADLLSSTADLLAGVELSRLRWLRDRKMGRPILTYDGLPAEMPKALEGSRRTAVSFLLEHDRARMLKVREPVVNLTDVLAGHFVPGGASVDAQRLDYLVAWAGAAAGSSLDHRAVADRIEAEQHTPGARLANRTSDALNSALVQLRRGRSSRYRSLVLDELQYKVDVVEAAEAALGTVPDSNLQPAYRSLEGDAQAVWRRRRELRASDLVRFGRTYPYWRNQLVDVISADNLCAAQVVALTSPARAAERASDAGERNLTWARVVSTDPLTIDVASRRLVAGDRVVLVTAGDEAWLETAGVSVVPQKRSIRLRGFCLGPLSDPDDPQRPAGRFEWNPGLTPTLSLGDRIVLARLDWFNPLRSDTEFNLDRPRRDDQAAPGPNCSEQAYEADPQAHRWCCKPHLSVEADFADEIALRRARSELNPQAWPPVSDPDEFEVAPVGQPTSRTVEVPTTAAPDGVTRDDLD